MNSTDRKQAKRVMVDLFGHDMMLTRRRIVVEMPSDSDDESLKTIGGVELDGMADLNESDAGWETEECECSEVLDEITINGNVPEHLVADVVLVFSDAGELVTAERHF